MWRIVYDYVMLFLSVAIILGCVAHLALLRMIDGELRVALTTLFVAIGFANVVFFVHGVAIGVPYVSNDIVRLIFRTVMFLGVFGCYYKLWSLAKESNRQS